MKLIQNSFTGVGSASVATTLTGSRIDITIYDQIEIEIDTIMPAVITVLYYPIDNKLTDVITRVYPILANNKSTLTIDILQRLIQVNVVIDAGAHPYSFITNAHRQYRPTEPIRASNTLGLYSMLVGNWYQVLSIGNTIGAVWNQVGALLPQQGESLPPIGRAFCCIAIGPLVSGGGQVVSIVYSNNVNVSGSIIGGTVAVSNFPAVQAVSGTVNVGTLPSITIANTSFDVGNFPATQVVSGTVDVGTLPSITIANTSFEVSNLVPLPSANIRTASELIVGNWFKVESLGNTIGAVWNQMGAIIGSEPDPPIGRVFKCLMNGNGTGTVSSIIYSQNVDIASLPPIAITNTSFDVSNFPATQVVSGTVDVGILPSITIANTSFDVGNFPATQVVSGTVDVGTLPSITIANTSFEVSNLVPLPSANIRTASELIVGNWFKVESLGNTIGAVWNQMGAIIGGESDPPIGRVFKCLMNGNGTGTVSTIIYSQNFEIASLPPIAITNTSFDVGNFPATQAVSGTVNIGNYPAVQPVQLPYYDTTTLDTINATSQTIAIASIGNQILNSLTISSSEPASLSGNISFLKFYNNVTATEVDTPILKVGILSNQSLTLSPAILFGALCVRATALWDDIDTTAPNGVIYGTFFYTGYA
jgi:predicted enzyme related to lactoylglutathione lyase